MQRPRRLTKAQKKSLGQRIGKHLEESGIVVRDHDNNGIWCCVLLPTILIMYSKQDVSSTYTTVAYASVGLLTYSILISVFLCISSLAFKNRAYEGCTASTLVSTLLIYCFQDKSLFFSLLLSAAAVCSYYLILRFALHELPNTFTFGEATVVCQAIVLFGAMSAAKLTCEEGGPDFVNIFIYSGFSAVTAVIILMRILEKHERTITTLTIVGVIVLICTTSIMQYVLGEYYFSEFFQFVFINKQRKMLISFWLSLVSLAVVAIVVRVAYGTKATTAMRKVFHILASAVFMSGILVDLDLTRLATGLAFALVVLLEALRKLEVENISTSLQKAFDLYCDDKDSGCLAMTPIYLFVGLASPLLLVPRNESDQLEMLSGVLSIGIGDSAASWLGSKYGRKKWSDSERTLEGTISNILAQMSTIYFLQYMEVLNSEKALLRGFVAALVSSLVEARTKQVDNLVLPLVSLIAFRCVSFVKQTPTILEDLSTSGTIDK